MSINKYLLVFILSLSLTGCGSNIIEPISNNQDAQNGTNTEIVSYSIDEIAQHNSSESCWLLIDGKVYDVTKMISGHAGGDAILQGCGTDATELYFTRPMGSGTPHSSKAQSYLPNFYIGDIE